MQIEHSILITAPKEKIWQMLIDVENWKLWDHDVESAKLNGEFAVGTRGILINKQQNISRFIITEINAPNFYCNFYYFPWLTHLHFKHEIESVDEQCKVTFIADFKGLLAWYYYRKHQDAIKIVMRQALENLKSALIFP